MNRKILIALSATLILSLSTLYLSDFTSELVEDIKSYDLVQTSNQITNQVVGQIEKYTEILYSLKGLMSSNENVSRKYFNDFIISTNILERLPGIQALEYTRYVKLADKDVYEDSVRNDTSLDEEGYPDFAIYPAGEREEYFVVDYIVPFEGNEAAYGFDLGSNPSRLEAVRKSINSGLPIATEPIKLVQETANQSAFLLLLAVYNTSLPLDTIEQRQDALLGFVNAVFRMDDLMISIFDEESDELHIEIYDVDETGSTTFIEENLLFDPDGSGHAMNLASFDSGFTYQISYIGVGSRIWAIFIHDPPTTSYDQLEISPLIILILGLIISILVGLIFYVILSSKEITDKSNLLLTQSLQQEEQNKVREMDYSKKLENQVLQRTEDLQSVIEQLSQKNAQTNIIIETISDALIVTDERHIIIVCNNAALEMFDANRTAVFGKPIESIIHDGILLDKIKAIMHKKIDNSFEFTLNDKILYVTVTRIINNEIYIDQVLILMRDVTDEREVDRMKTEFITTAAHELRTPLTSIQGFSEILLTKDDLSEEDKRRYLNIIQEKSQTLSFIVSDLLDISRIELDWKLELNKEWCDVNDSIPIILKSYREKFKNHTFELKITDEPKKIYVDKQRFQQVSENLLSNAVKYSPSGGLIEIEVIIDEYFFNMIIKDEGIGIPENKIDKIFDKFYRVDNSSTAPSGSGIGLTLVKSIIDAHNGSIAIKNNIKKGITVKLSIPIINAE